MIEFDIISKRMDQRRTFREDIQSWLLLYKIYSDDWTIDCELIICVMSGLPNMDCFLLSRLNAMDKISSVSLSIYIIHPFGISCVMWRNATTSLLATYTYMNFFNHSSHIPCLIGRCLNRKKFYFIEYIERYNCTILVIILIR